MNTTNDYLIRKWRNTDQYDIEQANLIYCDIKSHHGLQCNHIGDTPEHDEIMRLCAEIIERIRRIEILNKEP